MTIFIVMTLRGKAELFLWAKLRENWESHNPASEIIVTREIWFSKSLVVGTVGIVCVRSDGGWEKMKSNRRID